MALRRRRLRLLRGLDRRRACRLRDRLLLPLALVPTVGPEPVVPIIGITALFTNGARVAAFWRHIDAGRAWRVFVVAAVHGRFRHLLHVAVRTRRQPAPRPDALAARAVAAPPGALALRARKRRARARGGGLRHARRGTTGSGVVLISILMASGL